MISNAALSIDSNFGIESPDFTISSFPLPKAGIMELDDYIHNYLKKHLRVELVHNVHTFIEADDTYSADLYLDDDLIYSSTETIEYIQ